MLAIKDVPVPIQDLLLLDNGMLLSCAYDGKIKCWKYQNNELHDEIVKQGQELRCMGAVTENGTLLVGTNALPGTILTTSIVDWCNYGNLGETHGALGYNGEEEKWDDSEYGSQAMGGYGDEDDFDPLDGRTLDGQVDHILQEQ